MNIVKLHIAISARQALAKGGSNKTVLRVIRAGYGEMRAPCHDALGPKQPFQGNKTKGVCSIRPTVSPPAATEVVHASFPNRR
jgi:hypothetical protein